MYIIMVAAGYGNEQSVGDVRGYVANEKSWEAHGIRVIRTYEAYASRGNKYAYNRFPIFKYYRRFLKRSYNACSGFN